MYQLKELRQATWKVVVRTNKDGPKWASHGARQEHDWRYALKSITFDRRLGSQKVPVAALIASVVLKNNSDSAVPFRSMRGVRKIIAHDYGGVDLEEGRKTATDDLPSLVEIMERHFA